MATAASKTFHNLPHTAANADGRRITTPVANRSCFSLVEVYGGYRSARSESIQVGTEADARSCEKVSKVLQNRARRVSRVFG